MLISKSDVISIIKAFAEIVHPRKDGEVVFGYLQQVGGQVLEAPDALGTADIELCCEGLGRLDGDAPMALATRLRQFLDQRAAQSP